MRQTKHFVLTICLILFSISIAIGQLENNFGSTRDVIRMMGRMYQDTAWTKPMTRASITISILSNSGDRYKGKNKDGSPAINPEFKPEYRQLGKIESNSEGGYTFHVDQQREYLIAYAKPGYRRRMVELITYLSKDDLESLKPKMRGGIVVYSLSGTLEPYEEGEIGPPVENLSSRILYSAELKGFTLREDLQTQSIESGIVATSRLSKTPQAEVQTKSQDAFEQMELLTDVVKGEISMVFGGDTINMIDSNLNRSGSWIYFGANSDDPSYSDNAKVFEGEYDDGLKTDQWVKYHPNEEKAVELSFQRGQFTGAFKTYFEGGNIESKGSYDQQLDGKISEFQMFYESGGIKADFEYGEDGKKNGQQFVYHPNGNLAVSAMFKNDILDGPMYIMNRTGELMEQRVYASGKLIKTERMSNDEISADLDSLINLIVKDDSSAVTKVRVALSELSLIEQQYDTILAEQMKEMNELRSKLTVAELNMLQSEKETNRIRALNALKEEKLRQNRWLLIGASFVIGVILLLVLLLFKRNKERAKANKLLSNQKLEIEMQHELLVEKNHEILDSIIYAKRIQTAILPPNALIQECLPSCFILYKPKDIVAGDFYWLEAIGDVIYFAAADCTGHGVPGAMVSVICNNGLNRSVREFGLTVPSKILNKTRELILQEFGKSEEDVKDGMDISMCALNIKTYELQWAGAYNPLWIVSRRPLETSSIILSQIGTHNARLFEVKADNQPIGKYSRQADFTGHTLQLEKGDTIYIFSDGFADQFGGENGKKYKSGNFKKTLLDMADQPIDKQRELLDQEFENWRGELEQIDDVCVIGVRI